MWRAGCTLWGRDQSLRAQECKLAFCNFLDSTVMSQVPPLLEGCHAKPGVLAQLVDKVKLQAKTLIVILSVIVEGVYSGQIDFYR